MTELQFRLATTADICQLLSIEQAAHAFPWSEKLFAGSFGKRNFNYVMTRQDQIIGFYIASAVADECELLDIAVHPQFQKRGLGKQLLSHCLAQCAARLAARIWLEVRVSNQSAIGLYQAQGFVETGLRRHYYPAVNGREDAVVMCCQL